MNLTAWPHLKLIPVFFPYKHVFLCISYGKLKKLAKRLLFLVSHKILSGKHDFRGYIFGEAFCVTRPLISQELEVIESPSYESLT